MNPRTWLTAPRAIRRLDPMGKVMSVDGYESTLRQESNFWIGLEDGKFRNGSCPTRACSVAETPRSVLH